MRVCEICKRNRPVEDKRLCFPCAEKAYKHYLRMQPGFREDTVAREPRVAGYGKNRTWPYMRVRRTRNYVQGVMYQARTAGIVSPSLRRY